MVLLIGQLSLWEIAHRWCGFDPDNKAAIAQVGVCDTLRSLAQVTQHTLNLFNSKGDPDLNDFFPTMLRGESKSKLKDAIARCINERDYDPKVFDAAFILKDEFEKWCRLNNYALPAFWFREDEVAYYEEIRTASWGNRPAIDFLTDKLIVDVTDVKDVPASTPEAALDPAYKPSRLRPNQTDRLSIRAVAERLWALHPQLNIVEMIGRSEIKLECNGKQYKEKTLREWIKDLDPRPPDKRVGRPKRKQ